MQPLSFFVDRNIVPEKFDFSFSGERIGVAENVRPAGESDGMYFAIRLCTLRDLAKIGFAP